MACPRVFGTTLAKAIWQTQTQKEIKIRKKMQARACIFFVSFLNEILCFYKKI